ncbi:Os08g0360350 [Oryza sativa Japonica Group]|uniref:Os08g0360350 protein n=1 Tax=Oryza sativa subsp. japonica TaxID=39947 RepID=A0A0P0XF35_ORYSJ|nr:Os08g0360350 [Oryza sativa Japonica Group]
MISIEAELDTDPDWIGMIVYVYSSIGNSDSVFGLERLLVGKRLPSGQRKRKEEERESRQDLILAALFAGE